MRDQTRMRRMSCLGLQLWAQSFERQGPLLFHRSIDPPFTYSPRSSFMSTILILPLGKDFSVIVQVLQIRSILRHSSHIEVFTHGVFLSRRIALAGAAKFFTLCIASTMSGTTLFRPARTMTFRGPKVRPATLLP